MTAIPVPNCGSVTECFASSWDDFLCVCTQDDENNLLCVSAPNEETGENNDHVSQLVGVYETDCTTASSAPSTETRTIISGSPADWLNPSNATTEDGNYAVLPMTSQVTPTPASNYLVLTGYGFNIPAGSTIYGIVAVVKGQSNVGASLWNAALVLNGEFYYYADPSSYVPFPATFPTGEGPQFISPQAPYPVNQYHGQPVFGTFPLNNDQVNNLPPGDTLMPVLATQHTQYRTYMYDVGNRGRSSSSSALFPLPPNALSPNSLTMGAIINPAITSTFFGSPFPGCIPNGEFGLGPVEKTITIPALKQSWSAAEVNDPSFGVAVSFWNIQNTSQPCSLNCVAIAIYYVPGKLRPPNVCVNT